MTYVTHPTPPAGDNSQKIATTAWVKDITDALEENMSGGMFPKVNSAIYSNNAIYAPSGGTWWVYRFIDLPDNNTYNKSYSGGAKLSNANTNSQNMRFEYLCIKIA